MDRANVSSEGLKEDYISEISNIRCQRKHQERCTCGIIQDKAGSVRQEQKARRRKQAEVKVEMDALQNYGEEIKSASVELK